MRYIIWLCLLTLTGTGISQEFDLLIKGAHLIDPKNGLDGIMDVAISGDTVSRVAEEIPMASASRVIDGQDLYVSPGFVDIHSHNYHGVNPETEYSNGLNALNPDGFTFRSE